MKKSIFAVVATLGMMIGTGGVYAQNTQQQSRMMKERPTAEQMAQRQTDRMKEKLALTDAQAKQIYAYNLQQIKEMQAVREQMRAARQAEAAKMKSILTEEQFEKWQEMQGCYKGHGKMQKGDGKAGKCCQNSKKGGKGACCDGKKNK